LVKNKEYLNKNWLHKEYWVKGRNTKDIAEEVGCTDSNILQIMKRRSIKRRDRRWTKEQINKILELNKKGKTFKEIAEYFKGEKTYDAVRNTSYKVLRIKSNYNPAIRNKNIRRKISASLQGISIEDWDGFKEPNNALIRKSIPYKKWRTEIFERDDYTCQKCKKRSGGIYLVVHHIINFSKDLDKRMSMKNGITLCKECHLEFHNRYGRAKNNLKQINKYLKSKAFDLILDYEPKKP